MKKLNVLRYTSYIMLLVLFFTLTFVTSAKGIENFSPDTTISKKEPPQRKMDKMPEYPGGQKAMVAFISKHMKYPKKARKNKIEGKVVVKFMIKKDGGVVALSIIESVSPEIDKEAMRIINKMPNWTPAEYKGQPSTIFMNLPLNFLLEVK